MRNAFVLEGGFVVTTDNAGGIGQKEADVVQVSDRMVAQYAARVALLEQWAAFSDPMTILLHNFSGPTSWSRYVQGIEDVFADLSMQVPSITGSTETNMKMLQSGLAVTMIGRQRKSLERTEPLRWFTYGVPLVGREVLERSEEIASLSKIRTALCNNLIQSVWPVGSSGIYTEVQRLMGQQQTTVQSELPLDHSAGPATCVLLGMSTSQIPAAKQYFGPLMKVLHIS